MNSVITKLVLEMRRLILMMGAIFGLVWCGYYYLNSDIGLLSDETLINIISDDVLENDQYGTSCSRTSYEEKVFSESGGGKGSAHLTFNPIKGEEARCPPISVVASRRTGEAWIAGSVEKK
jgi:hypothetical protein